MGRAVLRLLAGLSQGLALVAYENLNLQQLLDSTQEAFTEDSGFESQKCSDSSTREFGDSDQSDSRRSLV